MFRLSIESKLSRDCSCTEQQSGKINCMIPTAESSGTTSEGQEITGRWVVLAWTDRTGQLKEPIRYFKFRFDVAKGKRLHPAIPSNKQNCYISEKYLGRLCLVQVRVNSRSSTQKMAWSHRQIFCLALPSRPASAVGDAWRQTRFSSSLSKQFSWKASLRD